MREALVKIFSLSLVLIFIYISDFVYCLDTKTLKVEDSFNIKDKIYTSINGRKLDSYLLNECLDEQSFLARLNKTGKTQYKKLVEQTSALESSYIFVPCDTKLEDQIFVLSSSFKINDQGVCILSFLSKKDINYLSNLKKHSVNQNILKDISYIDIDTDISYRIKNYYLNIYHGTASKLNSNQLKDRIYKDISSGYKRVITDHISSIESKSDYQSMWVLNQEGSLDNSMATMGRGQGFKESREDLTVFIYINPDSDLKGEVSIYEIYTK